jgi:hypothetical protein
MKKVNKKVQSYPGFKGYSLSGFLDPKALTIDNVAASPNLLNAVMSHVMAFKTGANASGTNVRRDLRAGVADLPGRDLVADPGKNGNTFEGSLKDFLKGIYLGNFTSSALNAHPTRGAQQYVYDIGFNTDRRVGFIVDNPFDTLITFEPDERKRPGKVSDLVSSRVPPLVSFNVETNEKSIRSKDGHISRIRETRITKADRPKGPQKPQNTCDLNLRIIVNNGNRLHSFSLFGNQVKIGLSKSLVQPVYKVNNGKYVKTGRRFLFPLGDRVITFRRNILPTWGGPIAVEGSLVSIRGSELIGRLKRINLGGTVEKPLIVFDDVELIKQ